MRKIQPVLQKFLISLALLFGVGWILLPPGAFSGSAKRSARSASCQSNLKLIALNHAQYVEDYDGKLPLISTGSRGWADLISPYRGGYPIFQCPEGERSSVPQSSDYFLNARLAGVDRKQIGSPNRTILFGEGVDNGATNSHFSELPFDWKIDDNSPAQRHRGRANYAFADGHVELLRPSLKTNRSRNGINDWTANFAGAK